MAAAIGELGHQSAELPLLPPGQQTVEQLEAPANHGSFLVASADASPRHLELWENEAYARYMRMHKVLVGVQGGRLLEGIYKELRQETLPDYLSAAGWAAAEASLVRVDLPTSHRLGLLDQALDSWDQAQSNIVYAGRHGLNWSDHGDGHRIALDIAVAPLLRGIIQGNVTKEACEDAFVGCLGVAQSNANALKSGLLHNELEVVSGHSGLGYESNGLLAFNRNMSQTWFVIPTMARCDSGHLYRGQTHDLLVIHQKYGAIHSATPVEVKAKASLRDRNRYDALLVRGKMHLSVEGKTRPEYTLDAIAAVYDGTASEEDKLIADNATNRFAAMVRDYYAGKLLVEMSGKHSVTTFRDDAQVVAKHPGLSKVAS